MTFIYSEETQQLGSYVERKNQQKYKQETFWATESNRNIFLHTHAVSVRTTHTRLWRVRGLYEDTHTRGTFRVMVHKKQADKKSMNQFFFQSLRHHEPQTSLHVSLDTAHLAVTSQWCQRRSHDVMVLSVRLNTYCFLSSLFHFTQRRFHFLILKLGN